MKEQYIDIDGQILKVRFNLKGYEAYFNSERQLHRLDGPARVWPDGSYYWCKDGKLHRIGGPALYDIIHYEWCVNNKKVEVYYIYG